MERLGRRMRRQRDTHRCGVWWGGGRKEQRPIVAPLPLPNRREGEGRAARGRGGKVGGESGFYTVMEELRNKRDGERGKQ